MVHIENFRYGIFNPALGYMLSCLGGFLGLRCVTRARAYSGHGRALWLSLAAVSVGATGIWAMHFVAMLGFGIPNQLIRYNIPITIASMLVAVAVVGIGLFIVGYSRQGVGPLLAGGAIIGVGVATMHYLGMAAMVMPDSMHYSTSLVALSVLIAIIAGTAALWAGLWVNGVRATLAASLIMGVAVTGMHYTGMAAMRVYPGSGMTTMPGATAISFLVPLLIGVGTVTFFITLIVATAPTEEEIRENTRIASQVE